MTTTAKHSKGEILQFVEEDDFGTDPAAGYEDLRIEGELTTSGQFSSSLQPETMFANAYETEKPVLVDVGVEGALSFNVGLTRGAAAGDDAQLVSLMKSAGWSEDSGADTTVAVATSQTVLELTADQGDPGRGIVVELEDGKYWPALVSSKSTVTVTLACGLPSVSGVGNAVNKCHTFYPGAVGPAAVSLWLRNITKAMSGVNYVMAEYGGVSVASFGDLEIVPGQIPYLSLTCNAAYHQVSTIAALPANNFRDGPGKKPSDGTYVQFANASASGAIASATVKLLGATIGLGTTTSQIPGIGDAECINNIQGNRKDPGDFVGTLRFLYPADRITDWEGTNTSKYIGIVQPSLNTTQPPWAIIMPNAHIMMDGVTWTKSGDENMHIVEVKYKANPAGYNSETAEGDKANQPIYLQVGTESA